MKTKKLIETGTRVKYAVGKGFAEGTVINNVDGHLTIRTKNGGKTGRDQAKVTKIAGGGFTPRTEPSYIAERPVVGLRSETLVV